MSLCVCSFTSGGMLKWHMVVNYSNLHVNAKDTLRFTGNDFTCYPLFLLSAVTVQALFTLHKQPCNKY